MIFRRKHAFAYILAIALDDVHRAQGEALPQATDTHLVRLSSPKLLLRLELLAPVIDPLHQAGAVEYADDSPRLLSVKMGEAGIADIPVHFGSRNLEGVLAVLVSSERVANAQLFSFVKIQILFLGFGGVP